MSESADPKLSVVLVTVDRFASIRQTAHHLRQQSVRGQIELVLVTPSSAALQDAAEDELQGFHSVLQVEAGDIVNIDKAAAHGIRRASAPVIALVEDHAFPEPGWAEAILTAHREPWAAVGSVFLNANPKTSLSWTNLLLSYGRWTEPLETGETDLISRHNVSFKKEVLAHAWDRLEGLLGREGHLLAELRRNNRSFYLESEARIRHVNPSRLASTLELRFFAGVIYGAMRAQRNRWSLFRRLVYILGGPLIPFVRIKRVRAEYFGRGRLQRLVPRIYPTLLFILGVDALGQMMGYAFGLGRSVERLARFEIDRFRHLTEDDRESLAEALRRQPVRI